VSLPAAVITVAAWLWSTGAARTLILLIAFPVAIAAYTLDISDRLGWIHLSETGGVITGWGHHDGSFFIIANSSSLLAYKETFKLLLIIAVPYLNVDKMADTAIDKSALFTITGEAMTIAIGLPTPSHLRITPPPNSKGGELFDVLVDFTLVIIPKDLSPEQIISLSDVERFGGKIVGNAATNVKFTTPRATP
jgi:hypothetical protein